MKTDKPKKKHSASKNYMLYDLPLFGVVVLTNDYVKTKIKAKLKKVNNKNTKSKQ